MKSIIVYGSEYGATKRYAEHLSEMTGIECVNYKDAKDVEKYDKVVYLGALYAGGVIGIKKTVAKMTENQVLIVATVGLADPTDAENVQNIRNSLKNQIPAAFYNENKIFHLRGAIDYNKLGLKHKLMMSLLHSKVSKLPESEQNAETRAMLETYGKIVDFVDFNSLEAIKNVILSNN